MSEPAAITPALCSPEYLAKLRDRAVMDDSASFDTVHERERLRNLLGHIEELTEQLSSASSAFGDVMLEMQRRKLLARPGATETTKRMLGAKSLTDDQLGTRAAEAFEAAVTMLAAVKHGDAQVLTCGTKDIEESAPDLRGRSNQGSVGAMKRLIAGIEVTGAARSWSEREDPATVYLRVRTGTGAQANAVLTPDEARSLAQALTAAAVEAEKKP